MRSAPPQSTQSRASLLAAAAGRFSVLLAGTACVTALAAALLGLATGTVLNRAVSLGLYLVGSFLVVAGFFFGNWGPVRMKADHDATPLGPRRVRWATADERFRAMN